MRTSAPWWAWSGSSARTSWLLRWRATNPGARTPGLSMDSWRNLGLAGLPFPEEHGGGGQPYSNYLLLIEELAYQYLSFAIGVSVHTLCSFAVNEFGTDAQKKDILSKLASGEWFGAYSLSESGSGSDAAALPRRPSVATVPTC